jgi:hypothetical protein
VTGDGRYAAVSRCWGPKSGRYLVVLCPSLSDAAKIWQGADCGALCSGDHVIYRLDIPVVRSLARR